LLLLLAIAQQVIAWVTVDSRYLFAFGPVFSMSAALMVCWMLIVVVFQSRAQHLCATCGYDLRGIDTEVCPECGSARVPPQW